jgi:D-arabinose 1-dehydrogenase-like Zn-dependent alcohol dehydrogenase
MIIGAGALGSSMLRIVNLYSPRKIIVVDIDEPKLEAALQNGATDVINSKTEDVVTRAKELTDGYGPTVVIDCACFHGSFLTACKAAGNASRVITMGFSIAPDEINQFVITSKELDVRGSRLQNHRFQTVIDLINKGKIDGLSEGNVLAVYKTGETVRDRVTGESVKIPDERSGLLMVFRTYEKLSYGLVLYATRDLALMDKVKNP